MKPHIPQKMHFMSPGKGVKLRLFQALRRDARPDSNSRPAVQILNSLSSRYVHHNLYQERNMVNQTSFSKPIKASMIHVLPPLILFLKKHNHLPCLLELSS